MPALWANHDDPPGRETLQEPYECDGCQRQGPFTLDTADSDWIDHQYMRIQQPPKRTRGGNAQEIDVHLEDDLTFLSKLAHHFARFRWIACCDSEPGPLITGREAENHVIVTLSFPLVEI